MQASMGDVFEFAIPCHPFNPQIRDLLNLTLLVTAREEVLEAAEWLQHLTTSLPSLRLEPLTILQVHQAFQAVGLKPPSNESLLQVLRNPFLLFLYARIVTHLDVPLETSGEVTAFQVVKEFWSRRVCAPSEGYRLEGPPENSAFAKRGAAKYLAEKTRDGHLAIGRPQEIAMNQGIQMLVHEGVLVTQGTHTVRWLHDWLREYSLVDLLISDIETLGPTSLAERVIELSAEEDRPDHVIRAAAVGSTKWAVSHPNRWGPVEDYLTTLHGKLPGPASGAVSDSHRGVRACTRTF